MTLDDFLTMTLPKRVKWLHGKNGPRGRLSHDVFADILNTKRQVLIGWEKGTEPNEASRAKLAEFSGFPAAAFSRRLAEPLVEEMLARRLGGLEREADWNRRLTLRIAAALTEHDIELPESPPDPQADDVPHPASPEEESG